MRLPQGKSQNKGQRGSKQAQLALESSSERKRMVAMSVLLVLVLVSFLAVRGQENRYRSQEVETLPNSALADLPIEIAAPEIDGEQIGELVSDLTETDRVLLDRDAIEFAFEQTSGLLDAHYIPLAGRELDDLSWRELSADPAGWRGQLYRVRGRVDGLKREQGSSGELWRGRLTTADQRTVHFALRKVPKDLEVGQWIRFDGLFLKAFRDEVDGEWIAGPLLAGRSAKASYPPLGVVSEIGAYDFLDVTDADKDYGGELEDYEEELALLLAYARDVDPDSIDWDAVPELDSDTLTSIYENGRQWRAQPVRLPVLRLLGITNLAVGENPARIEKVADGWIGSQMWKASNGLIHFRAPFPIEGLGRNDLITGRAFFFINEKYVPQKGGLSVASFFVLQDIQRHIPPPDNFVRNVTIAICGLVLLLAGTFWFALLRDSRRAKELRKELVRRRRERRTKAPSASS